jgi:ATP-dependent helicase/nuclease subunit B
MALMMQAGDFQPCAAEFDFGPDSAAPAVTLADTKDRVVQLSGRIDRVDIMPLKDGRNVAVLFDYKRGRTSALFRLDRWFYGLSLQTPLYALALKGMEMSGKTVDRCVGAFLMPIEIPLASKPFQERQTSHFQRKARGMFDGDFALSLDRQPGRYGSRLYSFSLKQGQPYGRLEESSAYSPKAYQMLLDYTHRKIVSLAERMIQGDIEISPYRLGREMPCDFCDYRSVCKFDVQINTYRPLTRLDRAAIMARLGENHA